MRIIKLFSALTFIQNAYSFVQVPSTSPRAPQAAYSELA